jgi:hypothetical protein
VVIKELEPDRMRQSGLVVPAGSHEPPPQHGIVLAIGQGVDWWEAAACRCRCARRPRRLPGVGRRLGRGRRGAPAGVPRHRAAGRARARRAALGRRPLGDALGEG